ncbi:MAG: DMT family transporter [Candidatus Marinimicrobia bacterium]|nr:DMT family transporter [Candidatus Neomarinimicrobiota bacterium]MCF7850361.1 DMT family transporter [Candidatus Neomarinimicrobiota bacterium]MCF7904486.1 DMT family transporter [Candidatus Neomarinimicrobiota bacterium]
MLKRFTSWTFAGPVAIIFAAFLWSLDALMRQALYSLPSMVIVFSEHALGLLVTLPWLIKFWPKIKNLERRTWISIFWIALFGGLLGTLAYTQALSYINYINFSVVVLLQKLQPIFAIVLARIVLKEQFQGRFFLWASMALFGSYLVAFPDIYPEWEDGGKNVLASLLALGAAFAWGSSTVMGKYSLRDLDSRIVTPLRLGLTALLSGTFLLLFMDLGTIPRLTQTQFLYLLAIVCSSGTVALSIYYFGLKKVQASQSTILEMFWPISAVVIDWIFFDHALTWSQILGALLMLTAIYRVSRRAQVNIDQ